MNVVMISGRLTRDVKLSYTAGGVALGKFSLAVQEDFKNKQGEREVNFIDCVAWRQSAEFMDKYTQKGNRVMVAGRLKQDRWEDKEGKKRNKLSVVVAKVEPIDWAGDEDGGKGNTRGDTRGADRGDDGDIQDEDMPF